MFLSSRCSLRLFGKNGSRFSIGRCSIIPASSSRNRASMQQRAAFTAPIVIRCSPRRPAMQSLDCDAAPHTFELWCAMVRHDVTCVDGAVARTPGPFARFCIGRYRRFRRSLRLEWNEVHGLPTPRLFFFVFILGRTATVNNWLAKRNVAISRNSATSMYGDRVKKHL